MKRYEVNKRMAGSGATRTYLAEDNEGFLNQFLIGEDRSRYKISLPVKFNTFSYGEISYSNPTLGHEHEYDITIQKLED